MLVRILLPIPSTVVMMAVIRVFSSNGVKTVVMMGETVNELPYDVADLDEQINEVAEETDDGF